MEEEQDWRRVDSRILGQILAAQNLMFVLPDEERIAQYYSQAMSSIPGVASCRVCLGGPLVPRATDDETCRGCAVAEEVLGGIVVWPPESRCGRATRSDERVIALRTSERVFGFFDFRIDASGAFESYLPFLRNLADFVALSLESRMRKRLLEKALGELEEKNRELSELNKCFVGRELRMVELKDRITALEHVSDHEGGGK